MRHPKRSWVDEAKHALYLLRRRRVHDPDYPDVDPISGDEEETEEDGAES